jgi:hypothetical protein
VPVKPSRHPDDYRDPEPFNVWWLIAASLFVAVALSRCPL